MSSEYSNPGTVNIEAARSGILANGGGEHIKTTPDGGEHHSVYSRDANWHLSYNVKDGDYSEVHTDKDNSGYMTYTGGGR